MAIALLLTAGIAHGQMGNQPDSGLEIDPLSFRGPDPASRYRDIEIEQKLEATVPLDLEFTNEVGQTVKLGDYFQGKPVLLALVYYECPSVCNVILNGVAAVTDAEANGLVPGKDYDIVTVSIDPEETPELAKAKKANYLREMRREGVEDGWHFLTGKEESIETLATAVGYRYQYDPVTDQYAHAAGIIFLTPQGIVSSYYLGTEFLPRNVRMALVDAGQGKIGKLVDRLVLLCYAYDPTAGTYGFYIMGAIRVFGTLVVLAIVAFWIISWRMGKRKQADAPPGEEQQAPAVPGAIAPGPR